MPALFACPYPAYSRSSSHAGEQASSARGPAATETASGHADLFLFPTFATKKLDLGSAAGAAVPFSFPSLCRISRPAALPVLPAPLAVRFSASLPALLQVS